MQANVDPEEIRNFDNLAKDWWDPKGQSRALHDINPTRLQFLTDNAAIANKHILDVGCGGGILLESMVKRGAHVTGLDASTALIEVAKQHAIINKLPSNHYHYVCSTLEDYASTHKEKFDLITCMELLEHVPDPSALLKTCASLLHAQGKLFLSTINRHPKAYLYAILGAEYALRLLPVGTHHYDKFIRPAELDRSLRNAGFTLETLAGIKYNPLTKTCRLTEDVSINYIVYASLH